MDMDYGHMDMNYGGHHMDNKDMNYIIQKNVFRPNLVPSIPDPRYGGGISQLTPEIQSRNSNIGGGGSKNGDKLMSAFLEPPGPPRYDSTHRPNNNNHHAATPRISSMSWANANGFIPSSSSKIRHPTPKYNNPTPQYNNPTPKFNNARNNEVSVRVTPMSNEKPNTIPMKIHQYVSPKTTTTMKPLKKQPAINFEPPKDMEKFTAQQIIRQQILNQQQAYNQVSKMIDLYL